LKPYSSTRNPNRFSSTSDVCSNRITLRPSRTRPTSGAGPSTVNAALPTTKTSYGERSAFAEICCARTPIVSSNLAVSPFGSNKAILATPGRRRSPSPPPPPPPAAGGAQGGEGARRAGEGECSHDRRERRQHIDDEMIFLRLAGSELRRQADFITAMRESLRQFKMNGNSRLIAGGHGHLTFARDGLRQVERPSGVASHGLARVVDHDDL